MPNGNLNTNTTIIEEFKSSNAIIRVHSDYIVNSEKKVNEILEELARIASAQLRVAGMA